MVQDDQVNNGVGEPLQLGDSWWKAALSEGEDSHINVTFTGAPDDSLSLPTFSHLTQPDKSNLFIHRCPPFLIPPI